MRLFFCTHCKAPVYFENLHCLRCRYRLAYQPESMEMVTLETDPKAESETGKSSDLSWRDGWRLCANRLTAAACNWLVGPHEKGSLCRACVLTEVYPDQSEPDNQQAWRLAEQAKKRWLYTVLGLGLTATPKSEDNPDGVLFQILQPDAEPTPVLTGHQDGLITINAAESDPVEREARRSELDEPYRTLLGHFRHESGHYYWQLLIEKHASRLEAFRELFGDERADYGEALQRHYKEGAPKHWEKSFISTYAASHPWEDFAETWAHYLHMAEALDVAQSWQVSFPAYPEAEVRAFADQADESTGFREMLARWLPLSLFANSLNRSLGHNDAYPFAPSGVVIEKLAWVHVLIGSARDWREPNRS